jgi:TATA-box binding protein (TBP) (component of TFIID and TFIIIB)
MPGKTNWIPFTPETPMDTPTLTTMVVLYTMGVKLNTDILVQELPLTESIIKIEKQGVLKRGESKRDRIKRRNAEVVPKRTTGFGHNSITMVLMSSGVGLREKEITIKIFQNGVFHITGVLDETYDRDVTTRIRRHIETFCPHAIVSGEWTPNIRRVVLMNYKTRLSGVTNLSRETLHSNLRKQGTKSNYEPAVYPAVKIYFEDKKWIAKVFRTGNVILTGMVSADECGELKTQLETLLVSGLGSCNGEHAQTIRAST